MTLRHIAVVALFAMTTGCLEDNEAILADAGTDAELEPDTTPDQTVTPDEGPTADAAPPAPSCGNEDDLFPNQSAEDAQPVETGFTRQDLFICPETSDWFRTAVTGGQPVTISVVADPPETDLDLVLFDPDGNELARSSGEDGQEQIEYQAEADGEVLVQVVGYQDQASFYSLTVAGFCRLDSQCGEGQICDRGEGRCTAAPMVSCGDDPLEPNNRDDAASEVELPASIEGVICGADRDWFALRAEDGDAFEILAEVDPGEDVDLYLVDDTGRIVASAVEDAQTNPERMSVSGLPAGDYRLVVTLYLAEGEPDRESDYVLEIVGRSDTGCAIDRDCVGDGAPLCVDGLCRPAEADAPLGGRCGDDDDCGDESELCWTGGTGGHDNVCTRSCQGDADCVALGAGATCQFVQQGLAICFPGCQSDDDCGIFYGCLGGACEVRGRCRADIDCVDGEQCTPTRTGDFYCAVPLPPAACGADAENDPNDRAVDATPLPLGERLEDLAICNADNDWYRLEVPAERAGDVLEVAVSFRAGVDIDVYVFDARGNQVGASTSPDMVEEVARIPFIAPGTYQVRVDQFQGDRLADTTYALEARLADGEGCTVAGGECNTTEPLRSICDEDTGGCRALEGEGMVELGGTCDSDDDCVPQAGLCWTFEGGGRFNICTGGCRGDGDCAAVPGTVCTPINQRFAICLPPRE